MERVVAASDIPTTELLSIGNLQVPKWPLKRVIKERWKHPRLVAPQRVHGDQSVSLF